MPAIRMKYISSSFISVSLLIPNTIQAFLPMANMNGSRALSSALNARKKIDVSTILANPTFPERWPYRPEDFKRMDETSDTVFYEQPRLVYHIDEGAVNALTKYYSTTLTPDCSILDICSSWVSHYPKMKFSRAVGLGMNKYELGKNKQLSEFVEQDLNVNPVMPFEDNSFDFVTCVVSIDYLNRPLEVFSEINRVLKPGGRCIISQSNRCFQTKVIDIWLRTNDYEHIFIIGSYFHYAGKFENLQSIDISPVKDNDGLMAALMGGGQAGDPMWIITATKEKPAKDNEL